MPNRTDEVSIECIFKQLNNNVDLLYKFVMLYIDYNTKLHDYGTGQLLSMIEAHTLSTIEESPGISISELAVLNKRTKGAVSQVVSKLVKKGLVRKMKDNNNAKVVLLYLTEEGLKISEAHRNYDIVGMTSTLKELLKECTFEEIAHFFKVIEHYTSVLHKKKL